MPVWPTRGRRSRYASPTSAPTPTTPSSWPPSFRAVATTAAAEWHAGTAPPPWRSELLRAAAWRAGRYGLAGTLVHPVDRELAPARRVLESLVDRMRPALEEAGDLDVVTAGFERLLGATGASRQRAAYERTGSLERMAADLVDRTEAAWRVG